MHDDKLIWLNQHYLKTLPLEVLLRYLEPFLQPEAGSMPKEDDGFCALVELLRERSRTLEEMADQARFFCVDGVEYEPKPARKFLKPEIAGTLRELQRGLSELPAWDVDTLRQAFDAVLPSSGLKLGALAQPVRVAITGKLRQPRHLRDPGAAGP